MARIILVVFAITSVCLIVAFVSGRILMSKAELDMVGNEPFGADTRFVETRSGRVHVYDKGAGSVILLLHGSGRSVADWQEGFGDRLAENHRVIGFDYFGHGLSDRTHGLSYGHQLWTQQAIDLLDALGIEQAVVVGHSVGGVIAARIAADFPERVTHVVTIGTGMAMDPTQQLLMVPGVGEWIMARETVFGDTFSAQHQERQERAYAIAGTRAAFLTYVRRQYTIDGLRLLWGVYEEIQAPVLHVSGTSDQAIPTEAARALTLRTGGTFAAVDAVGHDVHIEAPERLTTLIEQFLASS
jgi:2-hydroxymuconate-semialdehyde hydrolase